MVITLKTPCNGAAIFGEKLVTCGVHGRTRWVLLGQFYAIPPPILEVTCAAVDVEVGSLMDKDPGLRIFTSGGGFPEGTAEVDDPGSGGN